MGEEANQHPPAPHVTEKGVAVEFVEWVTQGSNPLAFAFSERVLGAWAGVLGILAIIIRFAAARPFEQIVAELQRGTVRGRDWYADPIRWYHLSTGLLVFACMLAALSVASAIRQSSMPERESQSDGKG